MLLLCVPVQFSRSVVSDSLRPHGLQLARLPCPAPTPEVYPNSCSLGQQCHATISSSVILFSHLQYFAASGTFQMSQFFKSGSQSIGVSASTSVLPMNTQASGSITSWQLDGETVSDFIFLCSKVTADGDCSHEIKRCLLLGRRVMTNLDSIFKSRDITLPTKV